MLGPLEQVSKGLSNVGLNILDGAASASKAVLGEQLSQQLFDNYVPLERLTEYQRTYNWEIVFPFSMGRVPGMVISKYCKAVAFGDYEIKEVFEQQRGPKSLFTPGTLSIDSVTAVFLVSTPNFVHGYFAAWRDKIISKEGYYSEQDKYKFPIYVRLYTTQGITAGTIKLIGAFPRSVFRYDLSYETEAVVRYNVVFSIDDVEFSGIDIGSSLPRVLRTVL